MTGVVLTFGGALAILDALTAEWLGRRRIGLFQNDWDPQPNQSISAVVPATFSGYDGLHDLAGWTTAALDGDQASSSAGEQLWSHSGGPVQNWIYGYYVVDLAGALQWAERDPNGPVALYGIGPPYRVVPVFTVRSRFPGR